MCPVSRPELSSLIVWPGTINQDEETKYGLDNDKQQMPQNKQ